MTRRLRQALRRHFLATQQAQLDHDARLPDPHQAYLDLLDETTRPLTRLHAPAAAPTPPRPPVPKHPGEESNLRPAV